MWAAGRWLQRFRSLSWLRQNTDKQRAGWCEASVGPGDFTAGCCCVVTPSRVYYSRHLPPVSLNSSPRILGSLALIPITSE